jgi:hypothetical protein
MVPPGVAVPVRRAVGRAAVAVARRLPASSPDAVHVSRGEGEPQAPPVSSRDTWDRDQCEEARRPLTDDLVAERTPAGPVPAGRRASLHLQAWHPERNAGRRGRRLPRRLSRRAAAAVNRAPLDGKRRAVGEGGRRIDRQHRGDHDASASREPWRRQQRPRQAKARAARRRRESPAGIAAERRSETWHARKNAAAGTTVPAQRHVPGPAVLAMSGHHRVYISWLLRRASDNDGITRHSW